MLKLGCIADDLTGATDLALMLSREGMNVVQTVGCPDQALELPEVDAIVVALKSRTVPPDMAVAQSIAAAKALKERGAERLFFKYCSTFDSTDRGNIGPVTEVLLALTGSDFTIACPSFPANGRTVYRGHLFVGDVLLNESGMKDHPLTPMRDANLVHVLQRQTHLSIGLVGYESVAGGVEMLRGAFEQARARGENIVVVDAVTDEQLRTVGAAAHDLSVITGGSGVAIGLPAAYGLKRKAETERRMAALPGRCAILAGSCSAQTRSQIAEALAAGIPALRIDPLALHTGTVEKSDVLSWVSRQSNELPLLVYSSADPERVQQVQRSIGREEAGALVEHLLAEVACALPAMGFTRMIVAGGETSGAVVSALDVKALRIGPEISPGVPWTRTLGGPDLALALKSGNFGETKFFVEAWTLLE